MTTNKRTGYSSLKENKRVKSIYATSQCCASGTKDDMRKDTRLKFRPETLNREIFLNVMHFERRRAG